MRYFYGMLAVGGWVWLAMVFGYLILRTRADRKSRDMTEVEHKD